VKRDQDGLLEKKERHRSEAARRPKTQKKDLTQRIVQGIRGSFQSDSREGTQSHVARMPERSRIVHSCAIGYMEKKVSRHTKRATWGGTNGGEIVRKRRTLKSGAHGGQFHPDKRRSGLSRGTKEKKHERWGPRTKK